MIALPIGTHAATSRPCGGRASQEHLIETRHRPVVPATPFNGPQNPESGVGPRIAVTVTPVAAFRDGEEAGAGGSFLETPS